MIRDEDGQLAGYVFVDMAGRDIGSYVEEAQKKVAEQVKIPVGYTLVWSGQYEYMQRAKERLIYVVPLTLLIIFLLLYVNFKSVAQVRDRAPGRSVLHDRSGLVALYFGLQHERRRLGRDHRLGRGGCRDRRHHALYLEHSYEKWRTEGRMQTIEDLHEAIIDGAVKRIRPKVMTIMAILMGLLPIMWSHGAGADVMKRIAAPMIGGVITSFLLELLVYPAIFDVWRGWKMRRATQKI